MLGPAEKVVIPLAGGNLSALLPQNSIRMEVYEILIMIQVMRYKSSSS
jgi:hypothetical protein